MGIFFITVNICSGARKATLDGPVNVVGGPNVLGSILYPNASVIDTQIATMRSTNIGSGSALINLL